VQNQRPRTRTTTKDEDDWEGSKQEPGKGTLARVVSMLTRLIDRFETDDTRNRVS
jgi:hypothetical protein